MNAEPVSATIWISKVVGAVAGSAISVAYLLPRGRREAATRFMIGTVIGIVFGPPAGLVIAERLALGDVLSSSELALMGSSAASLGAWWALGVLARFADGLFRTAGDARANHHDEGGDR